MQSKTDNKDDEEVSRETKACVCDFPGCSAKFSRPWKLACHRCIHTGERPYKCQVVCCQKSYTNVASLRRHEHNQHNDKGEKEKKLSEDVKLKCHHNDCDQMFSNKYSLKKHIDRKHNPDKPEVKCTKCDETVSDYRQLRWHMVKHNGDVKKRRKSFTCPYSDCQDGPDQVFADYSNLCSHLKLAHPFKFSCDRCDKLFTMENKFKRHKLSCEGNKTQFKCIVDNCKHVFKFRRNMLQHVEHRHGESRYTCTYNDCGKSFVWKASYTKHLRCHNSGNNEVGMDDVKEVTENEKPKKFGIEERCKQRKRRKDAGVPRHAVAELLCGIEVDCKMKQKLMTKDQVVNGTL